MRPTRELQRCWAEASRAAKEVLQGNISPGGPSLGLFDWIGEEVLILAEGRKDDTGKIRLDLLPGDALWEVGRVYTMGAGKYEDRNWEGGIAYGRVFAALLRHLWRWWCGETYDLQDRQHHLSSVIWAGLALLHYDLNPAKYQTFDNRPKDHTRPWVEPNKNSLPIQLELDLRS